MTWFGKHVVPGSLAAIYLVLVLVVSSPLLSDAIFNRCSAGTHSSAAMSLLLTLFLTLPLSYLGLAAMDAAPTDNESVSCLIFIAVAAASALINAFAIYVLARGVGKLIGWLRSRT